MYNYIPDSNFADVFQCDSGADFHDTIYISPKCETETSFLYAINRMGITRAVPQVFHVKRKTNSKCCHIFCFTRGSGVLRVDGLTYHLQTGMVVLLNNVSPHDYTSSPDDPLGVTWLEFYGSDSNRLMSHIIERGGHIRSGEIFVSVMASICKLIQAAHTNDNAQLSRQIYGIMMDLFDDIHTNARQQIEADIFRKFLPLDQYIENHMSEKIAIEGLSALVGYSGPHFSKLFKLVYGLPPYEYILQKRITAAKYLLSCSNMALGEIAASVGFFDTSHFMKRFKQYELVNPSEYRQTCQFSVRPRT